jgi:iron complex transport system permease protein
MGALFLLICDFISAHIAVIEIPVGIITAFVGTPFFVYLMLKKR